MLLEWDSNAAHLGLSRPVIAYLVRKYTSAIHGRQPAVGLEFCMRSGTRILRFLAGLLAVWRDMSRKIFQPRDRFGTECTGYCDDWTIARLCPEY